MQSLLSAGVSWLYTEFTLFSRWVMSTHMLDTLSPLWHKIRLWATNSPLGQTRLWATKLASVASAFMAEKNTRLYGNKDKNEQYNFGFRDNYQQRNRIHPAYVSGS